MNLKSHFSLVIVYQKECKSHIRSFFLSMEIIIGKTTMFPSKSLYENGVPKLCKNLASLLSLFLEHIM